MERTKKEKSFKKLFNRVLSYIILVASIFAVCFSIDKLTSYVKAKNDNKVLTERLNDLKDENNKLENLNTKLKDPNYFSIYVKGKYQYSPTDGSITPIN